MKAPFGLAKIIIPLVIAAALIAGGVMYATKWTPSHPASSPPASPPTSPPPIPLPTDCSGPGGRCAPGYTCIQKCGPPVVRVDEPPPGYYCELDSIASKPRMCPICLASNANISTPSGEVNVKDVTPGMRVWSVNAHGEKVASTVMAVSHTDVPSTHQVVDLVLSDGREVWVSPNHPTIDGGLVGDLRAGETYDGAVIESAALVPYWDDKTYDLLPDSATGEYWANGILLKSTLFPNRAERARLKQ